VIIALACLLPLAGAASPRSTAAAPPAHIIFTNTTVDHHLYGSYAAMAIGSDGHPQIAYHQQSGPSSSAARLSYAGWTGATWSTQSVADSELGGIVSIALDSDNKPHISFSACNPFSCSPRFADWTGSQWEVDTTLEGAGPLVVDTAGQPHMVYRGGNVIGQLSLRYAYRTGSQWIATTLASDLDELPALAIALDSQGRPHIAYYTKGALSYASWSGSAWSTAAVESRTNVGLAVGLKLDGADRPHLSYYDWNTGDLRYAVLTPTGWLTETVDSSGDVGKVADLVLDSDGGPHIAYYDATLHAIKYARLIGTRWEFFVVAANISDAPAISLGLDPQGMPLIAYTNWDDVGKDTSLNLARGQIAGAIYLPAVVRP
jgi:hypothetical protein